jgi:hypothetical protein
MPRSARLFVLALLLAAGVPPAVAGARPATAGVAPGYDLFVTPDGGGRIVLDTPVGGLRMLTFRGRSLGSFDFGRHGTHRVGRTDTIARRLDTATPANPKVRLELVGLLLESSNVPGYYVTLQSTRPLGLPSTGTIEFTFDRNGRGGVLRSELMVNYDVRHGSPTGPIVATGSTGMGFLAEDVLWSRTRPTRESQPPPECQGQLLCQYSHQPGEMCHASGIPEHWHCVRTDQTVPLISGVNHRLNGRDTSADFHATGNR